VDLQNRLCGPKTLGVLERALRTIVGDNLSISNYRMRESKKPAAASDSAMIIAHDLAQGEVIQTTRDVVVIGSVLAGSRIETLRSCFVFGASEGPLLPAHVAIRMPSLRALRSPAVHHCRLARPAPCFIWHRSACATITTWQGPFRENWTYSPTSWSRESL